MRGHPDPDVDVAVDVRARFRTYIHWIDDSNNQACIQDMDTNGRNPTVCSQGFASPIGSGAEAVDPWITTTEKKCVLAW